MTLPRSAFARAQLLLLTGGLALLIVIGGGVTWLVGETRLYAERVSNAQALQGKIGDLLSLFQDAETGQRGFLLTGREDYLTPYTKAVSELPEQMRIIAEAALADGALPRNVEALAAPAADRLDELRRTIDLVRAGDRGAALALVNTDRGKVAMDQVREALARLDRGATIRLRQRAEGLDRTANWLQAGVIVALFLELLIGAGAVLLAFRRTWELEKAQGDLAAANDSLEARVTERTADLAALNEEVQRFAYIVSHDLRAPLVNILGFTAETETSLGEIASLVEKLDKTHPGLVPEEARLAVAEDIPESLRFIKSSSERMDRLINAILKFSREGRRDLRPEALNMDAVAGALAEGMRTAVEAKGATLTVQKGLPRLTADRLAVEQILGNLLDNAAKYLDAARPGKIELRGGVVGKAAWFDVIDNGRGIDLRDQERIFDLFRRAGKQDTSGEGIGLAHVRALARRLGGNVRCSSTLGAGATFRLSMPLSPPADDARPHRESIA